MRTCKRILVSLLLLSAFAFGQRGGSPNVETSGNVYQEAFNGAVTCWASGTAACSWMWAIGAGTGQSIVTDAPSGSATSKALDLSIPLNTAAYMYTMLPNAIPSGDTVDVYFSGKMITNTMANGSGGEILCLSDTACSAIQCYAFLKEGTGVINMEGAGSTASADIQFSLNNWTNYRLHCQAGANLSSLSTDGSLCSAADTATCKRFTANAQPAIAISYGQHGSSHAAIDYRITNLAIRDAAHLTGTAEAGGGAPPNMYADFENSTNGTTATTAILNAGTHGGAASWSATSSFANFTVSTSCEKQLHNPISPFHTTFTDSGSTRGIKYDTSGVVSTANFPFPSPGSGGIVGTSASAGFYWLYHGLTNDGFGYDQLSVEGYGGSDFSLFQIASSGTNPQKFCLEPGGGGGPCENTNLPAQDTWYWVTVRYVTGGPNTMQVYETATWTKIADLSAVDASSAHPNVVRFGNPGGAHQGPAGSFACFDDIVVCYSGNCDLILP